MLEQFSRISKQDFSTYVEEVLHIRNEAKPNSHHKRAVNDSILFDPPDEPSSADLLYAAPQS